MVNFSAQGNGWEMTLSPHSLGLRIFVSVACPPKHTTHIAHTHTTYPHTYTYIHTHTHDCWNVLIEIVWDARQEWEPEGILSYWWDGIQVGMNLTHSGISSWESFNSVFKSFPWLVQPLKGYCGYMTTMVVWMRMALPWLVFECLVLS